MQFQTDFCVFMLDCTVSNCIVTWLWHGRAVSGLFSCVPLKQGFRAHLSNEEMNQEQLNSLTHLL